jgi:hypothetical protein
MSEPSEGGGPVRPHPIRQHTPGWRVPDVRGCWCDGEAICTEHTRQMVEDCEARERAVGHAVLAAVGGRAAYLLHITPHGVWLYDGERTVEDAATRALAALLAARTPTPETEGAP